MSSKEGSMVERVARAIFPAYFDAHMIEIERAITGDHRLDERVSRRQEDARRTARDAIEAMREPTEEMRACARNAGWHGGIEGIADAEEERGAALFTDMIDAALKEAPHVPL